MVSQRILAAFQLLFSTAGPLTFRNLSTLLSKHKNRPLRKMHQPVPVKIFFCWTITYFCDPFMCWKGIQSSYCSLFKALHSSKIRSVFVQIIPSLYKEVKFPKKSTWNINILVFLNSVFISTHTVLQLGKISWFQVWAAVPMLSSSLHRSSSCFFLFWASFNSTDRSVERGG